MNKSGQHYCIFLFFLTPLYVLHPLPPKPGTAAFAGKRHEHAKNHSNFQTPEISVNIRHVLETFHRFVIAWLVWGKRTQSLRPTHCCLLSSAKHTINSGKINTQTLSVLICWCACVAIVSTCWLHLSVLVVSAFTPFSSVAMMSREALLLHQELEGGCSSHRISLTLASSLQQCHHTAPLTLTKFWRGIPPRAT